MHTIRVSTELARILVKTNVTNSVTIDGDNETDREALGEWIGIKSDLRSELNELDYPVRDKCVCECTFCHPPSEG